MTKEITPGQQIGRWTVLNNYQKTPKSEKKWLCRCECGTERYVLERSLKHGGSLSCGCLREEALRKVIAYDLTGQTFGDLTVLGISEHQPKNGGQWWHCHCSCGEDCDFPATLLITGRRTRCSSKKHEKNYSYVDITGRRVGRLTVQYRTKKHAGKSGVVWHCKCDCGNEIDVTYNNLMYANQRSCGCQKKEHDLLLGKMQTRVDGTSLDIIKSKKLPADNTTGYKGVYLIKGKYMAKIVFRKKAYYLGTYDSIEDAHEARLDAEEALYQPTVEYQARWQARADADPEWAQENPIRISVNKANDRLRITFLPNLGAEDFSKKDG